MQQIKIFFKTLLGKVVLAFLALYILAFSVSQIGYYFMMKDEPPIVTQLFESAKTSKKVINKAGEIQSYTYTYNEYDVEGDSLNLHIGLAGDKAKVSIDTKLTKNAQKEWRIIKSDTVFSE